MPVFYCGVKKKEKKITGMIERCGSMEIYTSQVLKGKIHMPPKSSENRCNKIWWNSMRFGVLQLGSVAVPLTNYDMSGKILHLSVSGFSSIKTGGERERQIGLLQRPKKARTPFLKTQLLFPRSSGAFL